MTTDNNNKIPQIKKKISAYVLGEEGKISKQSIITLGAFLGAAALGGVLTAKDAKAEDVTTHHNELHFRYDPGDDQAIGAHSHHASHNSY